MEAIVPVVLAGGKGSRLWPLSRESSPKQLLNIFGDNTLLQETLLRCSNMTLAPPIIVYNEGYHFQIVEQLQKVGIREATFIMEPVPKNTAPAIALAAFEAQEHNSDAYLFVMPADHYLHFKMDVDFAQQLVLAKSLAEKNYLVTFGISPTAAKTGYGYIQAGDALCGREAFSIAAFIEKPSLQKAEMYSHRGDFFWNSGIFFFRASDYLAELKSFATDIFTVCFNSYMKARRDTDRVSIDPSFANCPSVSIDYAVMEHTKSAAVIPLDATWSDMGCWTSIFDLQPKNEHGNVIHGDVIAESTYNSYLHSTHRLLATVGLDDHIVVETRDSVLVAHKNKSQEIKKIVDHLTHHKRKEASAHCHVERPWGKFEILIDTSKYKVKKLIVEVGCSLSLQRHKHRSEHWIIVSGVATIINGENHLVLYPSQSTYIPQGVKHRLSNFSDQPLEVIEVQLGEYLDEDDIERLEDIYGRDEKMV